MIHPKSVQIEVVLINERDIEYPTATFQFPVFCEWESYMFSRLRAIIRNHESAPTSCRCPTVGYMEAID